VNTGPLYLVSITVFLGIAAAVCLKTASSYSEDDFLLITLFFLAALFFNVLRFFIWGAAHKRYPISLSYPLASTFFPLILLVEHFFYGELVTTGKMLGALTIMLGVGLLVKEEKSAND